MKACNTTNCTRCIPLSAKANTRDATKPWVSICWCCWSWLIWDYEPLDGRGGHTKDDVVNVFKAIYCTYLGGILSRTVTRTRGLRFDSHLPFCCYPESCIIMVSSLSFDIICSVSWHDLHKDTKRSKAEPLISGAQWLCFSTLVDGLVILDSTPLGIW